jgi:hypothetical protein
MAEHELAGITGDPNAPLPGLLCPAPLLTGFVLDVRGPVTTCGRDAVHVVATPRPSMRDRTMRRHLWRDRIEVIVDTQLGILLHRQEMADGQIVSLTQLTSLTLDPPQAADDSRFRPPPGAIIGESVGESMREFFDQPGWRAAKTAVGLGAGGLGAWVRYSPSHRWKTTTEHDPEPDMPPEEPEPLDPSPVPDELLYLLYRNGSEAPELAATLHQWSDIPAMMSRIPDSARDMGYGGLGSLVDALGERVPRTHLVAAMRTGGHGRYRIDYVIHPGQRPPKAIACDGLRHWALYADRLKTGPAAPPPHELADLIDASWLLECRLSGGAEVTIGNRQGYRVSIADGITPNQWGVIFPAEAVVDAELGVLLRLTCYVDGTPATRSELRDISTSPSEPAVFRIDPPPGVRIVEETGHPFADAVADAPGPAGVAAPAAVDVAKRTGDAVAAARSFLDNLRRPLRSRLTQPIGCHNIATSRLLFAGGSHEDTAHRYRAGVGDGAPAAAGEGEGTDPGRRRPGRPASADAVAGGGEGLRVRRARGEGEPAGPVRGPSSAGHIPGVLRARRDRLARPRVPRLLHDGRPGRRCRPPERPRHDLRLRLARAAAGHRAPEGTDGLGDALVHHHRRLGPRLRR